MSKKRKRPEPAPPAVNREWFDRDYTAKEVYRRLWGFARRYRRLIFLGAFLGMVTGGAWVPLFSAVQPMLKSMEVETVDTTSVSARLEREGRRLAETAKAIGHEGAALGRAPETAPLRAGEVSRLGTAVGQSSEAVLTVAKELSPEAQAASRLERQNQAEAAKYLRYLAQAERWLGKVGISGPAATVTVFGLVMALAVLLKMVTQYLNQYYLTKAGMKVVMDVRNAMFDHLQAQSLAFHGRADVGRLMSRATGDPETIRTLISQTMSDLCRAPFEVLGAVIFVCWFAIHNGMMSLLLIAVFGYPLCMLPVVWLGKRIRQWSTRLLAQSAEIGSNFHENLTCVRVVKAYHTEAQESEKYHLYNLKALKMCLRAVRLSILVGPLTETVAILLATLFAVYCFATGHGLAEIIPLALPFIILYKPMKQIGRLQTALENGRAALQRIFSLLDVHEELVERPDALPITAFRERLVFDHVDFRYAGKGELVVRDASFEIRPGQMYAVVGSTGSGKSTLANLLARFYDVSGGRVLLDGHDIREYRIADLRTVIGAVTQESILFNDTVAANIAYGTPGATQEQIEAAARLANAHDFIMAHPEGYARVVGEKGFVLSGGERQRVAIARAILRNPPILILDEATSALDTVTEQQVQAAIDNLMKERTIFAIAHRLSTVRKADCILVLDQGVIKERGTHEELYALGGLYRRLCDIQNRETSEN